MGLLAIDFLFMESVFCEQLHCPPKLSHKVKMNRSFLYFTSSAISLCVNLLFYRISFV
jgi:hypothetical protein